MAKSRTAKNLRAAKLLERRWHALPAACRCGSLDVRSLAPAAFRPYCARTRACRFLSTLCSSAETLASAFLSLSCSGCCPSNVDSAFCKPRDAQTHRLSVDRHKKSLGKSDTAHESDVGTTHRGVVESGTNATDIVFSRDESTRHPVHHLGYPGDDYGRQLWNCAL